MGRVVAVGLRQEWLAGSAVEVLRWCGIGASWVLRQLDPHGLILTGRRRSQPWKTVCCPPPLPSQFLAVTPPPSLEPRPVPSPFSVCPLLPLTPSQLCSPCTPHSPLSPPYPCYVLASQVGIYSSLTSSLLAPVRALITVGCASYRKLPTPPPSLSLSSLVLARNLGGHPATCTS